MWCVQYSVFDNSFLIINNRNNPSPKSLSYAFAYCSMQDWNEKLFKNKQKCAMPLQRISSDSVPHHITAVAEPAAECIVVRYRIRVKLKSVLRKICNYTSGLIHLRHAEWLGASLVNVVSFPSSFHGKVLLLYEAMKSAEACPRPLGTPNMFYGRPLAIISNDDY